MNDDDDAHLVKCADWPNVPYTHIATCFGQHGAS